MLAFGIVAPFGPALPRKPVTVTRRPTGRLRIDAAV
jgi:hypothetical protein